MRRQGIPAVSAAPDQPFSRLRPFFERPTVRVTVAAAAFALVVLTAQQAASRAIPQPAPSAPPSILPTNVGIGIATNQTIGIDFAAPMQPQTVAGGLLVYPTTATRLTWSADGRHLGIAPVTRWQTDERYLIIVPSSATRSDGRSLGDALRFSFTTRTAPTIRSFTVRRAGAQAAAKSLSPQAASGETAAPPADTTAGASAGTSIGIGFSDAMNRPEVERSLLLSPAVPGAFSWEGTTLTFTPSRRLDPSTRYTISIVGAHDLQGNELGGDLSFSFTIASRAAVTKVTPASGAKDVTSRTVQLRFSGTVDPGVTAAALRVVDLATKKAIAGSVAWSVDHSVLTFTASAALAAGHHFQIQLGPGARDADGNAIQATYSFTTRAARAASRPGIVYPAPSASASVQAYALALINTSRRAFGFAPLVLDARLSAVAAAHAWDQIRYNYFSHVSRDGSTFRDRITAAGISWSHAGENQCEDYGGITHAISWCHSIMMAEPYPGVWNHIANILDPNFTRVGFGYGEASDGKLIMTWDFIG